MPVEVAGPRTRVTTVSEPTSGHTLTARTESPDGAYHKVHYACTCGKIAKGYSKNLATARSQANTLFAAHARAAALPPEQRRSENRNAAVILGVPALVCLVLVVLLGLGLARSLDGLTGEPDGDPAPTRFLDTPGGGIDCEQAVSTLMERLYGSWGSGAWPEGEYAERLEQCRSR